MRTTIASATLQLLERNNLRFCFDEVFGTSGGALSSAYFLAGQIDIGHSTFSEEGQSPDFITMRAWPNVLNIPFMFDECAERRKPLDIRALAEQKTLLHIFATRVSDGTMHSFEVHDEPTLALRWLRASCSTPMMTRHTEPIGDHRFNDGDIEASIPILPAKKRGITHALVLLTESAENQRKRTVAARLFEWLRLRPFSSDYRAAYLKGYAHHEINRVCAFDGCGATMSTWVLCPAKDSDVHISPFDRSLSSIRKTEAEVLARVSPLLELCAPPDPWKAVTTHLARVAL